jgi:hypothetical protein
MKAFVAIGFAIATTWMLYFFFPALSHTAFNLNTLEVAWSTCLFVALAIVSLRAVYSKKGR